MIGPNTLLPVAIRWRWSHVSGKGVSLRIRLRQRLEHHLGPTTVSKVVQRCKWYQSVTRQALSLIGSVDVGTETRVRPLSDGTKDTVYLKLLMSPTRWRTVTCTLASSQWVWCTHLNTSTMNIPSLYFVTINDEKYRWNDVSNCCFEAHLLSRKYVYYFDRVWMMITHLWDNFGCNMVTDMNYISVEVSVQERRIRRSISSSHDRPVWVSKHVRYLYHCEYLLPTSLPTRWITYASYVRWILIAKYDTRSKEKVGSPLSTDTRSSTLTRLTMTNDAL